MKSMTRLLTILSLLCFTTVHAAEEEGFTIGAFGDSGSDTKTATLTRVSGKVQIFTSPSKAPPANRSLKAGTMAQFGSDYYSVENAKAGDKLEAGNILRTLADGQATLIYPNGDQLYISQSTSFKVALNSSETELDMIYGRLRGVISKEGPREKLKIKTSTATMGVRGTDFYVADSGSRAEFTVLRGRVDVSTAGAPPAEVKMGMSATASAAKQGSSNGSVAVRQSTKDDLNGVKKFEVQGSSDPKFAELEKKAASVALKDVAAYQPEYYKQIPDKMKAMLDAPKLTSLMTEMAINKAPAAQAGAQSLTGNMEPMQNQVADQKFKIGQAQ